MFGIGRIRFEFLTELEDLVIHGPGCRIRIIPPYLIEKSVACKDALSFFREELQELELVGGEDDGLAAAMDGHLLEVDFAIGEAVNRGQTGLALAPDGGVDPGREFARAEGLGDVVVCSEFEEKDLVGDFSDGAEDNDGGFAGLGLESLAEFATGDVGEDQVEDDGERPLAAKELERCVAVRRNDGGIAFLGEDAAEHSLHALIVFDDEDSAQAGGGRNFGLRFV